MRINPQHRKILAQYVSELRSHFENSLSQPLRSKLGNVVPTDISETKDLIQQFFTDLQSEPDGEFQLTETLRPIAKLAIQIARRRIAEEQESLREVSVSGDVHRRIDSLMDPIREFQSQDWYAKTKTLQLPAITDFLTLEVAYKAIFLLHGERPKTEFDSKFGILRSQKSFPSSLKFAREEALLRRTDTTIAFIDIDDFKTFNTALTETVVDREILRPVMRLIEAHCFSRGNAFQFGGDEYVLLLPNCDKASSERFLYRLQDRLSTLSFSITETRVTVSVGCCTVSSDAHYTDQEILDLASVAKAHAKQRKDCLAIYSGNDHLVESLVNVSRNDIVLGAKSW